MTYREENEHIFKDVRNIMLELCCSKIHQILNSRFKGEITVNYIFSRDIVVTVENRGINTTIRVPNAIDALRKGTDSSVIAGKIMSHYRNKILTYFFK